jgi:HAD superfamily hydrolase (TIGR01509 family)
MTPEALMRRRAVPLGLVIFDCDGVLVDSEPIADRLVSAELGRLGWALTPAEAGRMFLGMTLANMIPVIEARLGRKLPEGWELMIIDKTMAAMAAEATPIPGALEALGALSAIGLAWRVASNSSHDEMRVKFARIGAGELVAGRLHSHRDVARPKPAPDLFLAAAAAEGVAPDACVVVEDSVVGVRAAMAAGMDCLGYAARSDGAALRAAGAAPFASMFDLPGFLAVAKVAV